MVVTTDTTSKQQMFILQSCIKHTLYHRCSDCIVKDK
jgi:hypothetical protein